MTDSIARRRLLAVLGAGATTALAGCNADESGDAATDARTGTATEQVTALDEPASVPSDATCSVCGMTPSAFPAWNAQVIHEDGQRAYFDTSGCMAASVAVDDQFAATDSPVAGVWVTDFETGDLIDGQAAHYALETDPERVVRPLRPAGCTPVRPGRLIDD